MERKVAQTEFEPEEYSAFAKVAEKKGLSIKDALREAAQRWTLEESGINPDDSFFDIAAGRRRAEDLGPGSELFSQEVDKIVYGDSLSKKRIGKKTRLKGSRKTKHK
jgi:hypothetical protein